jgi:serine/threonine protein phosphatase PrpC
MNREVFEKFRQWRSLVGCTSTIFYADRRRIWLINAGDSPGMRLDSGGLQVLTKSDNRAHQLYLLGQISEEERWTHKTKNQLTQYIGMDAREVRLSPHICRLEPQGEPAVFLICSDGLLDRQKFSELEKLLRESAERDWLPQCAQRCVQYAMEHGSRDNISAIIVKVGATHDA